MLRKLIVVCCMCLCCTRLTNSCLLVCLLQIRLLPQYEQENELELLALRVAKFRKLPHGAKHDSVHSFGRESQLIAQLPTLSKM